MDNLLVVARSLTETKFFAAAQFPPPLFTYSQKEPVEAAKQNSDDTGQRALRSFVGVITLILLLTPLWPIAIIIIAFGVVALALRLIHAINQTLCIALTSLVGLSICCFVFLQFSMETRFQRLKDELAEYEHVSIRNRYFPWPGISRLSVGDGVTDSELSAILGLNGLADVSELYLKSDDLTDASLATVASKLKLNYVFIDCAKITDAAIFDFRNSFPDCTVIPYQRELRDGVMEVYLGPPPSGD